MLKVIEVLQGFPCHFRIQAFAFPSGSAVLHIGATRCAHYLTRCYSRFRLPLSGPVFHEQIVVAHHFLLHS